MERELVGMECKSSRAIALLRQTDIFKVLQITDDDKHK